MDLCEIVSRKGGLRNALAIPEGPRLHDLRHRLAVSTLLGWYRDGIDVERHMPALSTYLGHAHVTDTYWYLTATPELHALRAAANGTIGAGAPTMSSPRTFPGLLEAFFIDRLMRQRKVKLPHHRELSRYLSSAAELRTTNAEPSTPSDLTLTDLDTLLRRRVPGSP